NGGAATDEQASTTPENPIWINFARGMAPLRVPSAEFIAKLVGADQVRPMKVLDIAASHGVFGITIAKQKSETWIGAMCRKLQRKMRRKRECRIATRPSPAAPSMLISAADTMW